MQSLINNYYKLDPKLGFSYKLKPNLVQVSASLKLAPGGLDNGLRLFGMLVPTCWISAFGSFFNLLVQH